MKSVLFSILLGLAALGFSRPLCAEPIEKRIALVVGEASYPARPLATTANDAGLIAQTLQAAGFDVVGARDLDEDSLRRAFRDFVEKARTSGPDTVAFVYFAGYGLQLDGENYLVPVDADIGPQSDAPSRSMRVSDVLRPLSALPLKLSIMVLDAARAGPFSLSGQPLAGGLALVEPGAKNMLFAFDAAPGTVAPEEKGPYGAYAQALAEMIREGGVPLGDLFDRVRLRVAETTKGAQTPWNSACVDTPFFFFLRSDQAPASPIEQTASIASRPIRELGARDAYLAALERDTLQGYEEFLGAYPGDPLAKRVRAVVAARREAIIWRRTRVADSSAAYWTYLRRYPRGPHCGDARRRLTAISAALEPPPSFALIDYDVPPPPPEEIVFVERPILVFDDPYFDLPPPPPVPVYFLPPPPPALVVLAPPPVVVEPYVLPVPVFTPVPVGIAPPPYVAPPQNNFFFTNVHNTVIVDQTTNIVTVRDPGGHILSNASLKAAAAAGGVAAIAAALPPVLARKAAFPPPGATPGPAALGRQPAAGSAPLGGRPLSTTGLPPLPHQPAPALGGAHPPLQHPPAPVGAVAPHLPAAGPAPLGGKPLSTTGLPPLPHQPAPALGGAQPQPQHPSAPVGAVAPQPPVAGPAPLGGKPLSTTGLPPLPHQPAPALGGAHPSSQHPPGPVGAVAPQSPAAAGRRLPLGAGAPHRGPASGHLRSPAHGPTLRGNAAPLGLVAPPGPAGVSPGAAATHARAPFVPVVRPALHAPQRANLAPAFRPPVATYRPARPPIHQAPPYARSPAANFNRPQPSAAYGAPPAAYRHPPAVFRPPQPSAAPQIRAQAPRPVQAFSPQPRRCRIENGHPVCH